VDPSFGSCVDNGKSGGGRGGVWIWDIFVCLRHIFCLERITLKKSKLTCFVLLYRYQNLLQKDSILFQFVHLQMQNLLKG
jgi:hypothetical protein